MKVGMDKLDKIALMALAIAGSAVAMPAAAADQQLSASDYEELSAARDLMDQGKYARALRNLQSLLDDVEGIAYDEAIVLQTMGYAHLNNSQRASAIQDFKRALDRDALPAEPRHDVQRVLGRLYAADKQYDKARKILEEWLAQTSKDAGVEDYVALADVYAQLKDYDDGIGAIRKVIALNAKPERSHFQLLIAMLFQSKRYDEAAQTLEKMIGIWSQEEKYWTQLANTYLHQNEDRKAHTTLKLAYHKGLLDSQSELLNLVQIGMSVGLPDHAARVLSKGLENGTIDATRKHWQLLASAWTQAKETENAVQAYDRVAQFGSPGKYRLRQAELYMRENNWRKVLEYVKQAINSEGLDTPGKAYLLRGMAHTRLQEYGEGLAALNQARKYDNTAGQAGRWVKYVHRRQKLES